MPESTDRWTRGLIGAGVLAALVLLAQGQQLGGSLLADDFPLIFEVSTDGRADLSKGLEFFVRPAPGVDPPLPPEASPKFWRPLWRLSFAVDHAIWGVRPMGFQLTGLLLHLVCTLLLWRIACALRLEPLVALGGAAIFAVYPAHHEAVGWAAARCGPLSAAFSLVALAVLFSEGAGEARGRRVGRQVVACGALAAALLSKETALLTVPTAMCGVLSLELREGRALGGAARRTLARVGGLWVVLGGVLLLRHHMLGVFLGGYRYEPAPPGLSLRLQHLGESIVALFGPWKASVFGDFAPWLALASMSVVLVAALSGFRRPGTRALLGFLLAWLALTMAPLQQFPVSAATHLHARHLYEPAMALALLLAFGLAEMRGWFAGRIDPRRFLLVALGGVVLPSLVAAIVLGQERLRAAELAERVFDAARVASVHCRQPILALADVPSNSDGILIAENAFPTVLHPPFAEHPPPHTIRALTDSDDVLPRRRQLLEEALRRRDVALHVWRGEERGFVRASSSSYADVMSPPTGLD